MAWGMFSEVLNKVEVEHEPAFIKLIKLYAYVCQATENNDDNIYIWKTEYKDDVFHEILISAKPIVDITYCIAADNTRFFQLGDQLIELHPVEEHSSIKRWLLQSRELINKVLSAQCCKNNLLDWGELYEVAQSFLCTTGCKDAGHLAEIAAYVGSTNATKWYAANIT